MNQVFIAQYDLLTERQSLQMDKIPHPNQQHQQRFSALSPSGPL